MVRRYLSSQVFASAIHTGLIGAAELPSPVISVVMPWRIFDSTRLSTRRLSSDWPSMSMKPGATYFPPASTRRFAEAFSRLPTATILSPRTPTSARNHGAPVPSTTRPPATIRSSAAALAPSATRQPTSTSPRMRSRGIEPPRRATVAETSARPPEDVVQPAHPEPAVAVALDLHPVPAAPVGPRVVVGEHVGEEPTVRAAGAEGQRERLGIGVVEEHHSAVPPVVAEGESSP